MSALYGHRAEAHPLDQIIDHLAVHRKPYLQKIQRRLSGRPGGYAVKALPSGQNRLSARLHLSGHLFQRIFAVCSGKRSAQRSADPEGGFCAARIPDDHLRFSGPDAVSAFRSKMNALHINLRNLLHAHPAGNSAIGIIIVGNVQSRMLSKAVVHPYGDLMLSCLHSRNNRRKRRIRIVMLRGLFSVKENPRRVADPLEFQPQTGIPLHLYFCPVGSLPSVSEHVRMLLPAARHRKPVCLPVILPDKIPHSVQFFLFPDFVLIK